MKTETTKNSDLAKLGELLEPMSIAMLTTADDQGGLASQPMAPLKMDADGSIWFFTDVRSEKIRHLQKVNLAFSDEGNASYVSISGQAHIHTDRALMKQLWTPAVRPWFPDGVDSPDLGLLHVIPHEAEYWDAPHSRMVRAFAMAASVVAGKPVGLGDHAVISDLTPTPGTSARAV